MDPALTNLIAPAAALAVSVATFIFTQIRTQAVEDRTAAKDTVELLAIQNTALHSEVSDLRARLTTMELKHDACQRQLTSLAEQLVALRTAHASA